MRMRHQRQVASAVYRYGLWSVVWAAFEGWCAARDHRQATT